MNLKQYIKLNALAIDRLGNTLCGGSDVCTISGRVGYNAQKGKRYWLVLQAIINFTFKPIDGPDHCLQAYKDEKKLPHKKGNDLMRLFLSIVVILGCIILIPIIRLIKIIGD